MLLLPLHTRQHSCDREDYALAMMGIYEACDVSTAADLFEWTYRRSQAKYKVVSESLGSPDPFRVNYREALNEAVGMVVRGRQPMADALVALSLPDEDALKFQQLLAQELHVLAVFNCARYRLGMRKPRRGATKDALASSCRQCGPPQRRITNA